jgi:hypothetical protein
MLFPVPPWGTAFQVTLSQGICSTTIAMDNMPASTASLSSHAPCRRSDVTHETPFGCTSSHIAMLPNSTPWDVHDFVHSRQPGSPNIRDTSARAESYQSFFFYKFSECCGPVFIIWPAVCSTKCSSYVANNKYFQSSSTCVEPHRHS